MTTRAQRKKRTKHTRATLFSVIFILLAIAGIAVAGAIGVYHLCQEWEQDLPPVNDLESYSANTTTRIYASDGTTLLAELKLENREPVEQDQISQYVFDATVATEDERFYEHNGVDLYGIGRALITNLTTGGVSEGASTITQQLVRNTVLSDEMSEVSLRRKVREAKLAIEAEKIYSKDEILTMYCNTVNYGDGCYGIEAASQDYFGVSAKDLTLSQAALIAGIPNSPTRYNPRTNLDASIQRRNTVLDRMLSNGYITQEEHDAAQNEDVVLAEKVETPTNGIYQQPYFVDYVKKQLQNNYSTQEIFKGGLTVYTTLDMNCQSAAEEACNSSLEGEDEDLECALLSIEPSTGHIVAMYGGKDYYTDQYNLATQAHRQCGSSFKGITLATALEDGVSPDTVYNGNSPLQITGDWVVENDGGQSAGNVTLERATNMSLNTVYAALAVQLGPDKIVDMAHRLGITTSLESVPSITLGTQGVTCLEMANAYGTFANDGTHVDPVCITKILDRDGNVIYEENPTKTQAITPEIAYATTQVLEGDIYRGTATNAILSSGQIAAGKTGTTQDYRDAYFVGYTPQLSTAVWVGTRTERTYITMNGSLIYGSTACCPIWKKYMDAALEFYPKNMKFTEHEAPEYTKGNESGVALAPEAPPEEEKPTTDPNATQNNQSTTTGTTSGSTGTGGETGESGDTGTGTGETGSGTTTSP